MSDDMGAIDKYLEDLRAADTQSDDQFAELVARSFDVLGLEDKAIAHQFGVSRPTVARWKRGISSPHPAMRKHVYAFLISRAQAALNGGAEGAT